MRIGLDSAILASPQGSEIGGLYSYQLYLARALSKLIPHADFSLVVSAPQDHRAELVELSETVTERIGSQVRVEIVPTTFRRPYRLRRWWSLRRLACRNLDVFLHLSDSSQPLGPRVARCFLVPDLTTIHAAQHHLAGHSAEWAAVWRAVQAHADLVLTFSEHTRGDVAATLGIPADRIVAVPLAAGPEFRPLPATTVRAALAPLGLTPGGYVLTAGTIEPRKNHVTLFQAYAEYLRRPGAPRLPLVVAGGGGWMNGAIYAEPARLGLAESVKFVGRVPDLAPLYAGAAVMVYPSHYEGFGLPPLEAMACGCPVITSDATSLPEVVGDAGLMVAPDDVSGFADAMYRVVTDPALRADLSARGLARSAKFTWEKTAQGYLDAFRLAVARKRGER